MPLKFPPVTEPEHVIDDPVDVVPLKLKPPLVALPELECVPLAHENVAVQPD